MGRGSNQQPVYIQGDEVARDANNRLRTAHTFELFDSQFRYEINPNKWNQATVGSGTVTYQSASRTVRFRATTASGDRALIQSRRYFRTLPCKGYHAAWGALLGAGKTNVKQRLGIFENSEGFFFEYDNTTMYVVYRKESTDTRVAQTSWNMDKLDGAGPSKITADWTKAQAFVIEHEGSSIANTRFGLIIDGRTHYVHALRGFNTQTSGYTSLVQLPMRAEIYNSGASASNTDLTVFACTFQVEAAVTPQTFTGAAHRGYRGVAVTTKRPIMSIRPRTSYQGKTPRDAIRPYRVNLMSVTTPIFYELVQIRPGNGTLTGHNFTAANSHSMVLYDINATSQKGGELKQAGFVEANGKNQPPGVAGYQAVIEYLAANASGSTSDILTINASGIGGTATVYASIEWFEAV